MPPTPGGVCDRLNTMLSDPLFSIVARLAKAPSAANVDGVLLSELVECDFPGYAAVPLTPKIDDPVDEAHYGEIDSQRITFTVGAITVPQVITHLYVTKTYNGTGATLVMAVAFPEPIIVSRATQVLEWDINLAAIDEPA